MLVINRDIKLKLEQDFTQFRTEKNAIADYTAKTRDRVEKLRSEMIRLHRHNLALEATLQEKHLAIQRRLDGFTLAP